MIRLAKPVMTQEEFVAVQQVLESGMLVQGSECERFERELSDYLGVSDVVVVSSGTAALHLCLMAWDIGPGDAVIVPDFTFPATANVVERVGARPVLVDVDSASYNMTPGDLEEILAAWQKREDIRAVIPVHQFGRPADIVSILEIAAEKGLHVIEDAACALGASVEGKKIGGFGDCTCFSFHPRKAITTGEGGAIATNNGELAVTLRGLRSHGTEITESGPDIATAGLNYRMTEFQAAIGRVQLKKLDGFLKARKTIQQAYQEQLRATVIELPGDVDGHAWQTYMVMLPERVDRKGLIDELRMHGIECNLGAYAVHALRYYREKYPEDNLRLADSHASQLYRHGLALPLHAQMGIPDVQTVTKRLLSIV